MSESEENFGFGDRRLSLIDVSFEDDCLYRSLSRDFPIHNVSDDLMEHKSNNGQSLVEAVEGGEQTLQPLESLEAEGIRKNGKYNLRKSLAWDSAFFTSAGVLEPEELSSMIGGAEKGRKQVLTAIEEDVHRSMESISTSESDNLTLENLEADLFGDIRASIQKSSKLTNVANSSSKVETGSTENQLEQSSEKLNTASQKKTKAASKKPVAAVEGSGKITKHVSVGPPVSQSVATNGESASSVNKPPKVVGKVSPISTVATKRASLAANHVKVGKYNAKNSTAISDNATNSTVRVVKGPASSGSRNTVPKVAAARKMGLRTSSSFNSSENLSSDSSDKSSLHSLRRNYNSGDGIHSSSGSTDKNILKRTLKKRNPSTNSRVSPYLKSVTKLPSNISPASSISEWSSESLSPTSILNKRSNSSRPSLDTSSSKDPSGNGNAFEVLDSHSYSSDKCSVGHGTQVMGLLGQSVKRASIGSGAILRPDSTKPTGLRMPSPKIGFFDGVKSAARTPTGSIQSSPCVPNGLPRFRGGNGTPTEGSNETKLGKPQPARTVKAVSTTNVSAVDTKVKSPLHLQASNAAPKVSSASGKEKCSPGISPKHQKKPAQENGGEINSKSEGVAPNQSNIGSPSVLKDMLDADKKVHTPVNDKKIEPEVGDTSLSWKVGEDAVHNQNFNPENFHSLCNTKEKENGCFKGLVDDLTKQVGVVDINREIQKEPLGEYCSLSQVKL